MDWENNTVLKPAFVTTSRLKPASDGLDWKFAVAGNANLVTNNVSAFPIIAAAYAFGTGAGDDGRLAGVLPDGTVLDSFPEIVTNNVQQTSATFEIWFKPTELSGKQVLFETGGATDGASLRLNDSDLEFAVRNGSHPDPGSRDGLATTPLSSPPDFIQAVGRD